MKRHLLVLDGLRGVAALAVVFYHFGGRLPDFAPVQHGYLAVDFFFALSGFVIAYAYEARLRDGLGLRRFMTARVFRLMPLVVFGLCIGAVLELGRPNAGHFPTHIGHVALAWLFGILMVPLPVSLTLEQVVFPLNSVMWSLFFEFAINIAYALFAYRLTTRALAGIVLLAAPCLVATSFHFGGLDCGSGLEDWWGGGVRVVFSFSAGVLLYRLHDGAFMRASAPIGVLTAILLATLAVPHLPAPFDAGFDLVAVVLVCPLLICAGANAQAGAMAPLCRFGGDLSYPLYILHYRLVSMVSYAIRSRGYGIEGQAVGASLATVAIAAFAYVVYRGYDEPLRTSLIRVRDGRRTAKQSEFDGGSGPGGTSIARDGT